MVSIYFHELQPSEVFFFAAVFVHNKFKSIKFTTSLKCNIKLNFFKTKNIF